MHAQTLMRNKTCTHKNTVFACPKEPRKQCLHLEMHKVFSDRAYEMATIGQNKEASGSAHPHTYMEKGLTHRLLLAAKHVNQDDDNGQDEEETAQRSTAEATRQR